MITYTTPTPTPPVSSRGRPCCTTCHICIPDTAAHTSRVRPPRGLLTVMSPRLHDNSCLQSQCRLLPCPCVMSCRELLLTMSSRTNLQVSSRERALARSIFVSRLGRGLPTPYIPTGRGVLKVLTWGGRIQLRYVSSSSVLTTGPVRVVQGCP